MTGLETENIVLVLKHFKCVCVFLCDFILSEWIQENLKVNVPN